MSDISKLLLAQYKLEYETSDITVEDMCVKYSIDPKKLTGTSSWKKQTKVLVPQETLVPPTQLVTQKQDLKANISEFKELAISHCLNFMKTDARFAEVKEFKDIVSIVTAVEASNEKKADTGTNINILVQNITEKFRDDC